MSVHLSLLASLVPVVEDRAAHSALPHRAPSTRCTADLAHGVWYRCRRKGGSTRGGGAYGGAGGMPPGWKVMRDPNPDPNSDPNSGSNYCVDVPNMAAAP